MGKLIQTLTILLIISYFVSAFVSLQEINQCESLNEAQNNQAGIPSQVAAPSLSYDLNLTVSPWNKTNFSGEKYTTQQFDSLFPTMSSIDPPQNVSIHILSHINPFTILNFTDFHLSVDANVQIGILLPDYTWNNPFTSFNMTGYAQLQLVPKYGKIGFRLFIKDYGVNDVVIPTSETAKINKSALLDAVNTIGQLYIESANHYLAQKDILALDANDVDYFKLLA